MGILGGLNYNLERGRRGALFYTFIFGKTVMAVTIARRPFNPAVNLHSHPLLSRIYSARGIESDEQLSKQLSQLADYRTFKGIDTAATLLAQAVMSGKRLLIVGDFDCDGATSCAVGVLALRSMGAQVDYLVPNRFDYGYGLSPEIVEAAAPFNADVLITVDNGIASIAGVKAAKERGMTVIVTDHHLAGDELPAADAIVNPNQPDCAFESKATAGVGVIFYVMMALRAELRQRAYFQHRPEPSLGQWLDLVALGTVADVVALDRNNRILVHQGIARIRKGQCRPGITALIEVSGRQGWRLAASDLGFALGPRLNAAGRLDDISIGIELLLTDDEQHARTLAHHLDEFNQDRKSIESSMQDEAAAALNKLGALDDGSRLPWGLALYQQGWHQGVVGILASRIKEKHHRPVICFADAEGDSGELKGSARSIPGFHMRDALDLVFKQNPELIIKFGGHAMAAGLSIHQSNFAAFEKAFDAVVRQQLQAADLQAVLLTDGEITASEHSIEMAQTLRDGGPWGQHFPEPTFDGVFTLVQQRIVGQKHLKMVLRLPHSESWVDAIAFNVDVNRWPDPNVQQVRVVYKLDINYFRGEQNVQLLVDHLEPCSL